MVEGVAEYAEPNTESYRILVSEKAIKNMDPSFSGKPVYVRHVDAVDLHNLQAEADGYVVESFFNPTDGKHWAKFIVVSDAGHDAIRRGWKLSNAYIPKDLSQGGLWHGVEYSKEVMSGEYEHLAIVPNPRYEESVILTPEQFKQYNGEKELELKRLANSQETKGETEMLFFKKTKVENSADYESMSVTLPKSKVERTIGQLVNAVDDYELKMKEPQMANEDHHVMVNGEKMMVKDLVQKHMDCMNELADLKKPKEENDDGEGDDVSMDNADDDKAKEEPKKEKEEKKENEEDAEKKAKKNENYKSLKNAHLKGNKVDDEPTYELGITQVQRGKDRYGSK